MTFVILVFCCLLNTLQVVAVTDTSNYQILSDPIRQNLTTWKARCSGEPDIFV